MRKRTLLFVTPLFVVAILAALVNPAPGGPASVAAPHQIDFVSLEESLDPLKSAFNKSLSKPRILVLVSPT
jgi:hypothetical protein